MEYKIQVVNYSGFRGRLRENKREDRLDYSKKTIRSLSDEIDKILARFMEGND